jgi:hypothetical protein
MDPTNLAMVGVRPTRWLVAGHVPPADLRLVSAWVRLNQAALFDYWIIGTSPSTPMNFSPGCKNCRRDAECGIKQTVSAAPPGTISLNWPVCGGAQGRK